MKCFRLAWLLAPLTVLGCGGAPPPPAETAPSNAQVVAPGDALLVEAEAADLSPVSAPANLVLVGRWQAPGRTLDTLMGWANLPYDWRRLAQAKEPDLAGVVAVDAPIELCVALDPSETEDVAQPFAVVSVGLNSLERAVEVAKQLGERVRRVRPGVYEIEDPGQLHCAIAASRGATPARLVCGDRSRDLEELVPYATRGLPGEALDGSEIHFELRVEPLRRIYGRQLRQLRRVGIAHELRDVSLDGGRFDRALADAAYGLADEALALIEDVDQIALDFSADSAGGLLDTSFSVLLRSESSWTAQSLAEVGQASQVAPEIFWRLPADAHSAAFGVNGDPKRTAAIRRTLSELLDGALAHEKIPTSVRDRLVDIIDDSWLPGGAYALASGVLPDKLPPDANDSERERATVEQVLGWQVLVVKEGSARVRGYLDRIVRAYNDPVMRRIVDGKAGTASSDWPPFASRAPRGGKLPAGSRAYEFVVPGKAFSSYSVETSQMIEGRPLPLVVLVVPDGEYTLVGLSTNESVLAEKLAQVRSKASANTLQGRKDLAVLRQQRGVSGGYYTLVGLVSPQTLLAFDKSPEEARELAERLKRQIPHGGRTPIPFHATVTRENGKLRLRSHLQLPRATLEDIVAAAIAGGIGDL